jgi:hypothetical protein
MKRNTLKPCVAQNHNHVICTSIFTLTHHHSGLARVPLQVRYCGTDGC